MRRIRHISRTTAVLAATLATAAFGYFAATLIGEGEGHATAGSKATETYPVKVAFANGLAPGQSEPVSVTLEPKAATTIRSLVFTTSVDATHATAGCEASWFVVSATKEFGGFWTKLLEGKGEASITPGEELESEKAGIKVTFTETGTNQDACENAEVKIKARAS